MTTRLKKFLLVTTAIVAVAVVAPSAADAMPPIIGAIVAVAGVIGTAGSIAAVGFFGTTLTGFGAVFAHFAIRAALGYALQSLSKTGQRGTAGKGYSATVNSVGPSLPHQVIYGETRTGGAVFYQTTSGASNLYLHKCIAFAGHEINSYVAWYLNDELVTLDGSGLVTNGTFANKVRVTSHLGTATQAADAALVSEVTEWTTAHQAKGVAYAHVRFESDAAVFKNGTPVVSVVIRGREVYDPRSLTTAWSDNPALILRDYLLADFGLDDVSASINDVVFIDGADVCDQVVSGAKRYTCNGAFLLDAEPESVIQALTASAGGLFWFAQGKWGMKPAAYQAPTVSYNEDDLRGPMSIATRNSRRDNFNTVRGVYRGSETVWEESDYTEVTDATAVAEDGGVETAAEIPLLFTGTDVMAQRIATIALKRNRRQITITSHFGLKALQVGIGDTITLTNTRAGFTDKVFEVNDWRFSMTSEMDMQVQMLLREIDSGVFT